MDWLCEQRGLCRGILHTKGNEIVKRTNEHFHTSDNTAVSCREVKANLKRKAKHTQDSSHDIVSDSLQTVTEGATAKLPKLDSLKRTIQRQRVHHNVVTVQPTSMEQLFLPEEYKLKSKGEPFLLYDSGSETQRILIFGTQRNLEMLQSSKVWLADGTFKTTPLLFTQVYVITRHGENCSCCELSMLRIVHVANCRVANCSCCELSCCELSMLRIVVLRIVHVANCRVANCSCCELSVANCRVAKCRVAKCRTP